MRTVAACPTSRQPCVEQGGRRTTGCRSARGFPRVCLPLASGLSSRTSPLCSVPVLYVHCAERITVLNFCAADRTFGRYTSFPRLKEADHVHVILIS